ncbi:hypothetical protein QTG54_011051 [Skeletonema marinoi]|uniref:DUF1275 domain-containing protein n=1 Tax=Skeletonema marinoi TaxID=267567 RepID=A0AAD8Y3I4_9STRA|nr:hypothetical protein QTG54_011051 [Skeletonema marinoi]
MMKSSYILLCLLLALESVASTTTFFTTREKRIETWSKANEAAAAPLVLSRIKNTSLVCTGGESPDQRRIVHPLFFSSSMAALAGCSHVICIKRFQVYNAMMTGNIIGFGVALAEGNMSEAKFRLSLLGSFFSGTICARSLQSRSLCRDNKHHKVVAPLAFGMFAIADRIPENHKKKLVLLSAAFGLVYATANHTLNATITQLMTGHITKLGAAISDRVGSANRCFNSGTATSFSILTSFTIGCALGARIFLAVGQEKPIFTIIGAIYAVLLLLFRG